MKQRTQIDERSGLTPKDEFPEEPVLSPRLMDQAYQRIREEIIQCRLRPATEVTEASLAGRYGLGKAPIRSALSRLTQDGLVQAVARRGYVIAPITIRDVQETYELRMILEPAGARAAVGRADVGYLRSLCRKLRYSYNPNDYETFLAVHHEFHVSIARASGNRKLTELIASLLSDMARLINFGEFAPDRDLPSLERDHQLQQEHHEGIVEALAAGDPKLVETAMREHIVHSRDMVKEALFSIRSDVSL